jgi:hypothetical protein
VVVDVSAGVVVGGRSTDGKRDKDLFLRSRLSSRLARSKCLLRRDVSSSASVLLYWPTCDELWRKVRVCLVLLSPTARSRLDRRLQVSVF